MPTLHETQRALRASLLHGAPPPAELSARSAARIGVYRGNVFANLTAALRLSFPAVARLVGEECFNGWAAHLIAKQPPRSGDLYAYDCEFAEYLTHAPGMSLAWLPDVARLEWAINRALAASPTASLDPASLAALPDEQVPGLRFIPCPGLSLLALDHPAEAIWRAVLDDDAPRRYRSLASIDPASGGTQLAVLPGADGFTLLQLCPRSLRLAEALAGGARLGEALAIIPPDGAASLLGALIGQGIFITATPE